MQRTNTPPAGFIPADIEVGTELAGRWSINQVIERLSTGIPYASVEEAGANGTVHFDHGRHPWRIAERCDGLEFAEKPSEVSNDAL